MCKERLLASMLVLGLLGCGGGEPSIEHAESEGGFEDCRRVRPSDAASLSARAREYFLREVGTEVASVEVTGIAYCADATFVVLTAKTRRAPFPAQWLVSIRPGPPEHWDLVRPE